MSDDGQAAIRHYSLQLLTAFLRSDAAKEASNPADLVARVPVFLATPGVQLLFNEGLKQLRHAAASDLQVSRRGDAFQRLMTHPLADAFQAGDLSRDIIPGYFSFLHLVLGDVRETVSQDCMDILGELKQDPHFSWDLFYHDPRVQKLQWNALARIAESFKRFELRRDWFIGLMQNRPHAVSLGANAFVPLTHNHTVEEAHPFGLQQFNLLFRCLFEPLRDLAPGERAAFQKLFGEVPEVHFHLIYRNLA